ncbi:hypothetical protein VNO80_05705 [Phaseolus coccineus]|uniref:Uncharacterized protein n=1 Tax=Phaseolus coccineus TaxID=3886 RepID=A0AAN9NFK3_PHACN
MLLLSSFWKTTAPLYMHSTSLLHFFIHQLPPHVFHGVAATSEMLLDPKTIVDPGYDHMQSVFMCYVVLLVFMYCMVVKLKECTRNRQRTMVMTRNRHKHGSGSGIGNGRRIEE